MPTSAIYGTGVYGDSRYGVILIKGSSSITFSKGKALLSQTVRIRGSSNTSFQTRGLVKGRARTSANSTLKFTTSARLLAMAKAKSTTSLTFLTKGKAFGSYRLSGSTSLKFNTSSHILYRRVGSGLSLLVLDTESLLLGTANAKLSTTLRFDPETDITGTANGSFVGRIDFTSSGILSGTTSLRAQSGILFNELGYLKGAGRLGPVVSNLVFNQYAVLNRFPLKAKSISLTFNLNAKELNYSTTLPWFNTIVPNNNKPYDDRYVDNYLVIYEDTEGFYRKPYQDTQKEVT